MIPNTIPLSIIIKYDSICLKPSIHMIVNIVREMISKQTLNLRWENNTNRMNTSKIRIWNEVWWEFRWHKLRIMPYLTFYIYIIFTTDQSSAAKQTIHILNAAYSVICDIVYGSTGWICHQNKEREYIFNLFTVFLCTIYCMF